MFVLLMQIFQKVKRRLDNISIHTFAGFSIAVVIKTTNICIIYQNPWEKIYFHKIKFGAYVFLPVFKHLISFVNMDFPRVLVCKKIINIIENSGSVSGRKLNLSKTVCYPLGMLKYTMDGETTLRYKYKNQFWNKCLGIYIWGKTKP